MGYGVYVSLLVPVAGGGIALRALLDEWLISSIVWLGMPVLLHAAAASRLEAIGASSRSALVPGCRLVLCLALDPPPKHEETSICGEMRKAMPLGRLRRGRDGE